MGSRRRKYYVHYFVCLCLAVFLFDSVDTGKAASTSDVAEIDEEIERLSKVKRIEKAVGTSEISDVDDEIHRLSMVKRKKLTLLSDGRSCKTSDLQNVHMCSDKESFDSPITPEIQHGEKCIQLKGQRYTANLCVDGQWQMIESANRSPYFTRCTPSITTFYTSNGATSRTVTWDIPTAWDPEDGSIHPYPVRRIKSSHCWTSGWWWRRRRHCSHTYFPHYGGRFAASARGTRYGITYRATDRHRASATCTFYITVKITSCGIPVKPSNGFVSCPLGTDAGKRCYFYCYSGFTVSHSYKDCQSDGTWSPVNPVTCTRNVVCSTSLPTFSNGNYSCPSDTYTAGLTCYPRCDSGYTLRVSYPIICQITNSNTGNWYRASLPECADSSPPTIHNCPSSINQMADSRMTSAVVTWTTPTATDNHDATAPVPVKITGNINSGDRIESGTTHSIVYAATDTAGNQAKCNFTVTVNTVTCNTLSAIANGHYNSCSHGFIYGSSCTYMCNTGYEIQGTSTLTCKADGSWSATIPSCSIKTCDSPESLNHTFSNGHYDCPDTITYLTTCEAVCDHGYDLDQSGSILCRTGDPQYTVTGSPMCNDNTPPTFDNCEGTQTFSMEADKGKTTANITYELPTATDVVDPDPVVEKIQGPDIGDELYELETAFVQFQATDDSDNPSATCTYELTVTVHKCDALAPPIGGSISCTADNIYGSVCTLTCTTGYELVDLDTIECFKNSTWSNSFDCQQIICPNGPVDFEHGSYFCHATSYPYGTICTASCNYGFQLENDTHTQCSADKTWQASREPVCNDIEPPVIQNCEDLITFTANEGSRSTSVTWDVPTATDNLDPDPFVNQTSGPEQGSILTGEATVTYQATDNSGVKSNVCVTRLVVEVIECPSAVWPDHGQISCDLDNIYGSECVYTCDTGYELSSDETVKCLNDTTWSYGDSPPTCDIISCGAPEMREHGRFECLDENYEYLSTCSLQCDVGFSTDTVILSKCQASKLWNYTSVDNCTDATPPTFSSCDTYQSFYMDEGKNGTNATWELPTAIDNFDDPDDIAINKVSGPDPGDFIEIGQTEVIYEAVDTQGNPSVENCTITLDVEEVFCDHPNVTFTDAVMSYGCANYKYGVNCTLSCGGVTHILNGSAWTVCKANFTNGEPTTYWSYDGDFIPYCEEVMCPKVFADPPNGAVIYTDNEYPIAYLACNENYDLQYQFSGQALCTTTGNETQWKPDEFPGCTRDKHPRFGFLETGFYYSGDCSNEETKEQIRQLVLSKQGDYAGTILEFDSVTVDCPESSKKKREIHNEDLKRLLDRHRGPSHQRPRRSETNLINVTIILKLEADITSYSAFLVVENSLLEAADVLKGLVENGDFHITALNIEATSFYQEDFADIACLAGQVLLGLECQSCSPGRYMAVTADSEGNEEMSCERCPIGTYADTDGLECTLCPEGKSTARTASIYLDECLDYCPAGQYSPGGLEPCIPCKLNEYQPQTRQSSCNACPGEQRTFSRGNSECFYYDIRFRPGSYSHTLYETKTASLGISFSFWYKKTAADQINVHITDTSGNNILSVTLSDGLTISSGATEATNDIPASNIWSHLAVSLHGTLNAFINGTSVVNELVLSSAVAPGSQVILGVTSASDIRLSGIGFYDTALDSSLVNTLYSSCLLGSTDSLFGSDDLVDLNFENIDVKPATCVAEDACLINPCNKHLCTPTTYGYACTCNNGYSGVNCEVPPDNCYSHDCENGATCVNTVSGFTCSCPPGYKGSKCENPPVNGGLSTWTEWSTCTVKCDGGTQQRSRMCNNPLPDEYGEDCSGELTQNQTCNTIACHVLNPCLSSPCQSGSTCTEIDSTYHCACLPGYTGTNCDEEVDHCLGNLCQNGATCLDQEDGYNCTCASQYTGTYCQTELSNVFYWTSWSACTVECGGGTSSRTRVCISSDPDISCQSEVQTRDCGMAQCIVDHCADSPCGSHTCLNEPNGYRCVCLTGYTGTMCSELIDHCAGAPLCGDGTCVSILTGYNCMCPEGYGGKDCSVPPVNGGWTDWTKWSDCSVTCGDGQRTRQRECSNPPPGLGGASCEGAESEESTCSIDCSDDCDTHDCGEGGDCVLNADGPACHCHEGYTGKLCENQLDPCNPDPCNNGGLCSGVGTSFMCDCVNGYTGDTCDDPPENSVWDVWNDWGECSVSCGEGGVQTRQRTCHTGTTGEDCVGESEESKQCNDDVECLVCSELQRKFGVIIDCNMTGETKICNVSCREGLVTSNGTDAIGLYQCGPDTAFEWDQTLDIPSCTTPNTGRGYNVRASLSTSTSIDCSQTDAVSSASTNMLSNSSCATSSNCQISASVSGCTNRRKRSEDSGSSTVTFDIVYNITSNDTDFDDMEIAMSELEETVVLLENGTAESLSIVVDGETITLDNTNMSLTGTVDCPEGYFANQEFCVGCSPGTRYDSTLSYCVECEQGTYQDQTGQITCISCGDGYITNYTGSYDVSDCLYIPPEAYQYFSTESPTVVPSVQKEEDSSITAIIAGAVGGSVAAILTAIIVFVLWKKYLRTKQRVSQSQDWSSATVPVQPPFFSTNIVHKEPKNVSFNQAMTPLNLSREQSSVSVASTSNISLHDIDGSASMTPIR